MSEKHSESNLEGCFGRMKISDFSGAGMKMHEYFAEWLSLESTFLVVDELVRNSMLSTLPDVPSACSDSVAQPPRSPSKPSPKKRTQSEMLESLESAVSIQSSMLDALEFSKDNSVGIVEACLQDETKRDDDHNITANTRRKANFDTIPIFYSATTHSKRGQRRIDEDKLTQRLPEIEAFFKPFAGGIPVEKFVHVTKRLCGIPSFFNMPLCKRINQIFVDDESAATTGKLSAAATANSNRQAAIGTGTKIKLKSFLRYWSQEMEPYDSVERFFRLIKQPDSESICKDDFVPFIQELLHFHPGLDFLQSHDEFQRKYALTVITRIFYKVNRSRTGRISLRELRYSNLMAEFMHVDEETDINRVNEYFSYEHFYVLYCRFFELDANKNSKLFKDDLLKYGEHSLSESIVDRIFEVGCRVFTDGLEGGFLDPISAADKAAGNGVAVRSVTPAGGGGMSYPDFIYFMLSEEDKATECSLRYWFACCDLDGSGVLTMDKMRFFYQTQLARLTGLGQESVNFTDVICQMMDMICPEHAESITMKDLLKPNKMHLSGILFDILFNLHKFMRFEGRDPFQEKLRREDPFQCDWDRFAFTEYHRLAAEEEGYNNEGSGDDVDFSDSIDASSFGNNGGMDIDVEDEDDEEGHFQEAKEEQNNGFQNNMKRGVGRGNGNGASGDWYLDDEGDDPDATDGSHASTSSGAKKGSGNKKQQSKKSSNSRSYVRK